MAIYKLVKNSLRCSHDIHTVFTWHIDTVFARCYTLFNGSLVNTEK